MAIEGDAFGEPPAVFEDIATDYAHRIRRDVSIRDGDAGSARQEVRHEVLLGCDGRRFRVEVTARMTATREVYRLTAEVRPSRTASRSPRAASTRRSPATWLNRAGLRDLPEGIGQAA